MERSARTVSFQRQSRDMRVSTCCKVVTATLTSIPAHAIAETSHNLEVEIAPGGLLRAEHRLGVGSQRPGPFNAAGCDFDACLTLLLRIIEMTTLALTSQFPSSLWSLALGTVRSYDWFTPSDGTLVSGATCAEHWGTRRWAGILLRALQPTCSAYTLLHPTT
ncbi:hypothetical protein BDN72DRAFT_902021 [Pluteus cervinus]|uniref:Uncharacterized protein n=1 Tax=Pluteus cervinus TaxID=181527 RepID=A0ACD3ADZ5_9AGAR|nr:hypothetical protein BDN72DRAFT_902021 [Pluteus cervinus]